MKTVIACLALLLSITTNAQSISLKLVKKLDGAQAPKSVELSPDSNYAAIMNLEGCNIWIVDADSFYIRQKVEFDQTKATGWDYDLQKPIPSFAEKPVECDFSEHGKYLWVSFHNGSCVVRYNPYSPHTDSSVVCFKTKGQLATVKHPKGGDNSRVEMPLVPVGSTPKVIKVTPNGKLALVANWHSSSISIVTADSLKKIKDIKVGNGYYIPRGIAVSSNSKTAYICNMRGGTISVIDLDSLKQIKELHITPNPRHIVLSKNDSLLYVSENTGGKAIEYSIYKKKVTRSISLGSQVRTICLTPDEKYMFAAVHESNRIAVIDMKTFKEVSSIDIFKPMGVSVSPDGKHLWATSYQGGWVAVYEIQEK
jgi:DNA-binding beta-propeller fold protein YncE